MEESRRENLRTTQVLRFPRQLLLMSLLVVMLLPAATALGKQEEKFEKLPVFRASQILPNNLLTGSNYKILDEVHCDGFNYIYDLDTDYGPLRVESTALLKVRIRELAALAQMHKVEETEEFQQAFSKTAQDSANKTINLAKGLVENPTGTITGVASGVGSYLSGLGRSIKSGFEGLKNGGGGSAYDDSTWEKVIGFAKTKREVAARFKVDPYSDYQVLQDRLDKIAWAAFAGGKTFSMALGAVPGGAGIAISTTKFAADMNQAIVQKSPGELNEYNADKLKAMGIEPAVAKQFLEHRQYSPTRKTYIVGALDQMKGVDNRTAFLKAALVAANPTVAFYFQEQAIMYGMYHHKVKPLASFMLVGRYPFAQTKEGGTVGLFPIDYLVWTKEMAGKVEGSGGESIKGFDRKDKTLLLGGTLSKLARKNLMDMGWKIEENTAKKLLPNG